MKKILTLSILPIVFASSAFAGSSYVTGNVQFHTDTQPNATSTLEAGHTFDTGTTILTEFDGISLGKYDDDTIQDAREGYSPYITLGIEQSYAFNNHLWVAVGYHHLINNGETVQERPLVKIGYNFDNGISISNRTRYHFVKDGEDQIRFDNRISYSATEQLALSYNNVYVRNDGDADNSMDHELRATWARLGVQPYFEYRNQGNGTDNTNNAFVFGASYVF